MKPRNWVIKILLVVASFSLLIYLPPNTINNYSKSQLKVFDAFKSVLHKAAPPGTFTLSSNNTNFHDNQPINLSWSVSDGADNYSLYEIDDGDNLIKDGLTNHSYVILSISVGTHKYYIAAFNESGQTNSNIVTVIRKDEGIDKSADEAPSYSLLFMQYEIYLFIGFIIITVVVISLSIYQNKKHNKFEPFDRYKRRTKGSIAVARKEEYYKQQNGNHSKPTEYKNQKSMRSAKQMIEEKVDNQVLLEYFEGESQIDKKHELTSIPEDFLNRIDRFHWKNEDEKYNFIQEMISLTPEEREEIVDYMFEKANKDEYSD